MRKQGQVEGEGFVDDALTRRSVLKRGLGGVAVLSLPGVLAACGAGQTKVATQDLGKAVPGGRLRVGVTGGGSTETLDPTKTLLDVDVARVNQVFEPLTTFASDGSTVENLLAESIEVNADGTEWTIRLKPGIRFHNGNALTANDVIYTFKYNIDPKNGAVGAQQLASILPSSLKAIDKRTLRFRLKEPNVYFPANLADKVLGIFPEGTTDFSKPIGTGPFAFKSWKPGQSASYVRFDEYWVSGRPFLDEVEIVSMDDQQAKVSALLAGQLDVVAGVQLTAIPQIERSGKARVIETESAYWVGQYMFTQGPDAGPFADERVRQAMRLSVDRDLIVENAFLGRAKKANDLFCWQDVSYPTDLPQREFDPEQARSLLEQAGQADVSVSLYTADISPGVVDFATLFAQSAKESGINIQLRKIAPDAYWNERYMTAPFGSTYWAGRTYAPQGLVSLVPGASLNETLWDDKPWLKVFREALATTDEARSKQLLTDSQVILHERGGYMIPAFPNLVDGAASDVGGLVESPLSSLGYFDFRKTFISQKS